MKAIVQDTMRQPGGPHALQRLAVLVVNELTRERGSVIEDDSESQFR